MKRTQQEFKQLLEEIYLKGEYAQNIQLEKLIVEIQERLIIILNNRRRPRG